LVDEGGLGEGDDADLGVVAARDEGVDLIHAGRSEQRGGGAVAAQVGGFEVLAQELGAPVVGVVVLAAMGVFEEEAVLGKLVAGAGGEAPPEAGAAAVVGEVEQAPCIAEAVERQTRAMRELSRRAFPEPEVSSGDQPAPIDAVRVQRRREAEATRALALRRARAERAARKGSTAAGQLEDAAAAVELERTA
jgi:hypothetical protein